MRHFDLDAVLPLAPLVAELDRTVGRELAADLALAEPPAAIEKSSPTITRGRQNILLQERLFRAAREDQALLVRLDFCRFVCPSAATVDQTLELFVQPESRRAGMSRLLIGFGLPIFGLLIGLAGWRVLQYDTNMSSLAWLISGALIGLALSFWLMWRFAHHFGAFLEGRQALSSRANRRRIEENLGRAIAATIAKYAAAAASSTASEPDFPGTDPRRLATYAVELIADPDAAAKRYGLDRTANRERLADAFREMEKSPELNAAFLEARRNAEPHPSPASGD
ncbi:MAG: SoxR reducing system RseC family protein [Myxococcales bacterium]|nr:SoxR reducing system RseC family protein [Myxococcales bacterium]